VLIKKKIYFVIPDLIRDPDQRVG